MSSDKPQQSLPVLSEGLRNGLTALRSLSGRVQPPTILLKSDGVRAAWDIVGRTGRRFSFPFWTFLLGVVAPLACYLLYAAPFQSRGYVSEARLTVRASQKASGATDAASSLIGKLLSSSGLKASSQDGWIVLNYVRSASLIQDMGGVPALARLYSANSLDYFSRLDPDASIEDALKYWLRRLHVSLDTVSGIITLRVEAFSPAQATQVAQEVVRRSEDLINGISLRSRKDDVERNAVDVDSSRARLAAAREAVTQFRNENAMIDPGERVKSTTEILTKLTLEKIELESNVSLLSTSLAPSATGLRMPTARLAEINQQIEKLTQSLVGQSNNVVSAQIAKYEKLKLEEQFAEKLYSISVAGYERARQELERKQLYLITVVQPTTPQDATYPQIGVNMLLLLISLAIAWGIVCLFAASVEEQRV